MLIKVQFQLTKIKQKLIKTEMASQVELWLSLLRLLSNSYQTITVVCIERKLRAK